MNDFLFELCSESLESARAAEAGGADRIELCADLSIGGITPSLELMRAVLEALTIPVHVLIRPRGGNFTYSAEEFGLMLRQGEQTRQAGAAGVAIGMLHGDGRVEVERSRALVESAYPMRSTFHRAFDAAPELSEALEAVIETGADCLLTSGGKADVLTGAESIGQLREQAGSRLDVMAGGGLTLANLTEVVRQSGVSLLHGSLKRKPENGAGWENSAGNGLGWASGRGSARLEADVRHAIGLFREQRARSRPALCMREAGTAL